MAKNSTTYDAVKNPVAFKKRFSLLADTLEKMGVIDAKKKSLLLSEKLSFPSPRNSLPYVVDAVKNGTIEVSGTTTTFDIPLTHQIQKIAESVLQDIAWRNVGDYSVLLVDRKTKEIRVLIGGKDYGSSQ